MVCHPISPPNSVRIWASGTLVSRKALHLGEGGLDWAGAQEFTVPTQQFSGTGSPSQAPGSSPSSLGSWRSDVVLSKQEPDS